MSAADLLISSFLVLELTDMLGDIRGKILVVQGKVGFVPNVFILFDS